MNWEQKGKGIRGQRLVVFLPGLVTIALLHPRLKDLRPTRTDCFPNATSRLRVREQGAPDAIFISCAQRGRWRETGDESDETQNPRRRSALRPRSHD